MARCTMQTDAFEWTGNFDPTGEYLGTFLGLYTNLLGRTLMGYKHMPDAEGNELVPDLAPRRSRRSPTTA